MVGVAVAARTNRVSLALPVIVSDGLKRYLQNGDDGVCGDDTVTILCWRLYLRRLKLSVRE